LGKSNKTTHPKITRRKTMEEKKSAEQSSSTENVVEEGKIYAFLGYWGILFLIPILAKKDNEFAVFHGKQGLLLFILEIIAWVLGYIPFIGYIISPLGYIFCGIMAVIGMVQSLNGKYWKIPWIGEYAEKIKV
jgi:uncharacterized membrane protein